MATDNVQTEDESGAVGHVEKQYVQKRLLEEFGIPRLSLFYLS